MNIISEYQEGENAYLKIGGDSLECEADEVCFRCKAGVDDHGAPCMLWMRFIVFGRRGSRKFFIEQLEDRPVHGDGQGGGLGEGEDGEGEDGDGVFESNGRFSRRR